MIFIFSFLLQLSAQGSWHAELNHWPRTIIGEDDIQLIRDRVLVEPYSDLYASITANAAIDYDDCAMERDKAEVCRSAAFLFLIASEQTYAEKALDYLLVADREPADGYMETYENIIWDAENLTSICIAYDFLKGNNYDFNDNEATVRNNIMNIAAGLYDDIMEHYLIHIAWEAGGKKTNFGVKLASALGLAAIILNTESSDQEAEQPQTWINYSMNLLYEHYHQYLVDDDGGWAEGNHYQKFVAYNLIPFVFSHHNFLSGASEEYYGLLLPPWLEDENFQNSLEWGIKLRMPDGARPNFDDCFNQPYYFNGVFAQYYDNDTFAWDYMVSDNPYNILTSPGSIAVEIICLYDDTYPGATEPDFLTQFLPEAGQAVFRSSWEENAVYMCLLGEHGRARTGGLSHEHPDNMSFIIHAYGELLAMDCGYLSFAQHDSVRYADNHSLILVDGEGPSASTVATSGGTDAFIENYFDLPDIDFAEVQTNYLNTDFSRNVAFINDSYFIISDIITGSDIHTYDWLLHGNGGGDTENDFQLTDYGSQYTVNGIDLHLFINSDNEILLSDYDDYHEVNYETAGLHTVTKATVEAQNATFSAFLIPAPANGEILYNPLALENCSGGSIISGNEIILSLVKNNNDNIGSNLESIEFTTNAFVTNLVKEDEVIPGTIHLKNGSYFQYDDVDLIQSSQLTDLALNITDNEAFGYVTNNCALELFTGNMPVSVAGAESYIYNAGLLSLTLQDSSYFTLEVDWSLENTGSDDMAIPDNFILYQNYPNPFNPSTSISFAYPNSQADHNENAELTIFNLKGQIIRKLKLTNADLSDTGDFARELDEFDENKFTITWDGIDSKGRSLPSGIYLYRLNLENYSATRKMILLK
ncbi:MAG: hypothetical protein APR54_00475 [Candidatus Cloacimonas sp. SDB]|nr:MAG: hypothetical protein APR54_00475 [Candidatus Cloacimonas sp. SDB]